MVKQPVPYPSLDTPAVLVDMDKLEANIGEMSRLAKEAGVRLRTHIKVHECAEIAKMQLAAGACGVEVGPIAQAEAMAAEGIGDIIVAHPGYYGEQKLETLTKGKTTLFAQIRYHRRFGQQFISCFSLRHQHYFFLVNVSCFFYYFLYLRQIVGGIDYKFHLIPIVLSQHAQDSYIQSRVLVKFCELRLCRYRVA